MGTLFVILIPVGFLFCCLIYRAVIGGKKPPADSDKKNDQENDKKEDS